MGGKFYFVFASLDDADFDEVAAAAIRYMIRPSLRLSESVCGDDWVEKQRWTSNRQI